MVHRFLGKYNDFKCIADKCPDTCCSGWQIAIDDDSYDRYKSDGSSLFYDAMIEEDGEYFFSQKDNGDCHFLMENGLCNLICKKGEGYLCNTCDTYPRHIEEFSGVREYSLSISCPVVAKQLLDASHDEFIFTEKKDEELETEEFEEFDEELYLLLSEFRKDIVNFIIKDESDIILKKHVIIKYMRHIQDNWDNGDILNINIYQYINNQMDISRILSGITIDIVDSRDKLDLFMQLEPLRVEFRDLLYETIDWLNGIDDSIYRVFIDDFKNAFPNWNRYYTNIVLYFINSYMCGAVYDEYIYAMSVLGFYCADIIMILWTYQYSLSKTNFELSKVLYQFSRELENSNDNMILFERLIDEDMK